MDVAETTPQSVEDKLAAAFEKAGLRDDPEPQDTDDEPEQEEAQASGDSDDDDSEAQAQTDEASDEAEDIDYEGKSYRLPKELKEALLRQKDYTQKTQQVADLRKANEAQRETLQAETEFNKANFDKVVQAHALNVQLQQFAQVNWTELLESNPQRYLVLDKQQRDLQDAFHRLNAEMQQANGEFQQKRQQAKAKAQAACVDELKKSFPNFGTEFLQKLDETGKGYGFSGEELAQIADPRMVRVLHDAMQYKKLQGSKTIIDKKVQDARPVQAKSARSAQTSQANAQLLSAKQQMKKTGKASDVESFLAARFAKASR